MFYSNELIESTAKTSLVASGAHGTKQTLSIGEIDRSLVIRGNRGDLDAFGVLVRKYERPIMNFASQLLGDPVEAQDVAQNVFIQAFKQSGRFRFDCAFSTWLYVIARNLCRNELHRRSRRKEYSLDSADAKGDHLAKRHSVATTHDSAPEALIRREIEERIYQVLGALPERQSSAIRLLIDQDLSYEEISILEKTSVSTIKALIHRGRKELRRKLQPYFRTRHTGQGGVASRMVRVFNPKATAP